MPRAVVVLPSTSYRAADFVNAAESLGIDLVVASEQPPPFDMGDRYVQIDCSDPSQAAETVASLGDDVALDGVVAADDSGVLVAALAGTALGLGSNPPDAAAATRDKLLLRQRLEVSEVPQPAFAAVDVDSDAGDVVAAVGLPLVLKPLDRSASQGVVRVDRLDDLEDTAARVRRIIGDESATLLAESYMPGEEISIEGLVTGGQLQVLAILDKPDTRPGPAFPETIFVTPSRLPSATQDECVRVATAAVRGLGLTHGPVHIELKTEQGKARVLEIAARSIGGLCSRSLNFGLMGTSLETLILRNAIGLEKPELRREPSASGVLMIPIPRSGVLESIEGEEETRSIPGITGIDITVRPGSKVLAPPEGDRYLGFVFARGDTPDAVEDALRKAMGTMKIDIQGASSST